MAVKTAIAVSDIEWYDTANTLIFEEDVALALLLINEVVIIKSYWRMTHSINALDQTQPIANARWTEAESRLIDVSVNCSDIFDRAAVDAEPLPFDQIPKLYNMWRADQTWGPAQWCALQRQQLPHPQIIREMRADKAWPPEMEALQQRSAYT